FCGLYPEKQEYCLQYAAYRKAHEAKDASLCGASVDCRLLMGEGPKACAGSVENLKTYYCRDRAERESDPAARAADAPALRARAAAASAALARWKKLMDAFAAKDLPAYRAESERLARESKRLDAVRRRVDLFLEGAGPGRHAVAYLGGEPLLKFGVVRDAVLHVRKRAPKCRQY